MQVCWSSRQLVFKWPNAGRCTSSYKHVTVQEKKSCVHTAAEMYALHSWTSAPRHFLSLKKKNVCDSEWRYSGKAHLFSLLSPRFAPIFLPNMSSSSSLTSCSPYWLSYVSHKQAGLHFKGNDLCPLKWMNEGPYLCRSELQSAAQCYFGLMRSSTLNNTRLLLSQFLCRNKSSRLSYLQLWSL